MSQIFYYPERWDVTASQEEVRNLLLLSSHMFSSFFFSFFFTFIYLLSGRVSAGNMLIFIFCDAL